MSTVTTTAREDQAETRPENTRRCIVTGEAQPKDGLIRFAVSPDHIVIPDLAQNLPGRGLWVTAARDAIETAAHKNLFAKAAKAPARVAPGLADQVVQLLKKRCLDRIGLARGAGLAVVGQQQVEAALKAGKLALLLVADDAGAAGVEKMESRPVETSRRFTRDELGAALGHDQIVYAGLKAHGLTEKLRLELAQLEKIADKHHVSTGTDSGTT